jgi:Protein of unknown function (DUF3293)
MGRRPRQPADRARWFAKADVAPRSNKAASVGPPICGGFLLSGTEISAFGGSQIGRSTIEAYLSTEYRIWGERPLALRIGQRNADLAELYKRFVAESAGVITAWNPYSEQKSNEENLAAQAHLIVELDRRHLQHLPGHGADPTGNWPAEDSRLVLGIDLETATSLGEQFQQNGIVWATSDAVPKLILLR